jgi:hypothetical protein
LKLDTEHLEFHLSKYEQQGGFKGTAFQKKQFQDADSEEGGATVATSAAAVSFGDNGYLKDTCPTETLSMRSLKTTDRARKAAYAASKNTGRALKGLFNVTDERRDLDRVVN